MILTLTPNPAVDVTYEVDAVAARAEHRVRRVRTAAGGKGINVARVLAQLGRPTACAGPLGGTTGEEIRALLEDTEHLRQAWTPIIGPSRRTVTAVDPEGATGFNEPGPDLTADERDALRADLTALLTAGEPLVEAVTISGSLPPGLDSADLAALVRACREHDRPVLVDTSGPALREAAHAGAEVLKPNAAEALAATGADTPLAAVAALLGDGAGSVVCSLGEEGMLGARRTASAPGEPGRRPEMRAWRARLEQPLRGNPTGAGDAAVAVIASRLLVDGAALPEVLREAVAVSASAVTRPVAGAIDPELAARLTPAVVLEEIPCR
ncbi:1-phosphofructokinase family hexose kinase [Brachybacterium sp. AOP43-C2-M15]|uniref:1-phosphofructokinase family hexose kinase n=1 Tax=Brachybacterium sp. AOP43-C2-M15 TaxID=3457661 RepID=UPI0040333C30